MRVGKSSGARVGTVVGRGWTADDLPMLRLAWIVTGFPATLRTLLELEQALAANGGRECSPAA